MKFVPFIIGLLLITFLIADEVPQRSEPLELGSLIEPDPVGFSFDSPGWYFLAFIVLFIAIVLIVRWLHNYQKNAYRREALKKLAAINENIEGISSDAGINNVFVILKLVAIKTYGRSQIAPLYGKKWISFLESKGKETPFSDFESSITNALYAAKPINGDELEKLLNVSKRWIITHA